MTDAPSILLFISTGFFVLGLMMVKTEASPKEKKSAAENVLYVGTYEPKGTGISIYAMDPNTGALAYRGVSSPITNPSYIAIHPNRRWVFAVSELGEGTLSAFRINGPSALELINTVSSKGADPAYISIDNSGKYVLAANYSSGSVTSVPINPDGSLGTPVSTIANTATSVNKVRQSAPHAHSIIPSLAGDLLYSADLGADVIYSYKIDTATGALTAASKVAVAPGSGPRHLAFHSNTKWAYSVNEMAVSVDGFSIDPSSGALSHFQTCPMLKNNDSGATAADIHIGRSGKFLYASVRDPENLIITFSIDQTSGMLTQIGAVPTGGRGPRNFVIDPSGNFLLVGNQKTDTINIFRIDEKTGQLTQIGAPVASPTPVCIKFAD